MTAAAIGNVRSDKLRRRSLVLVLSILAHGLILGWFAFRHDRTLDDALVPAVDVQILDIARLPRPPPANSADAEVETPAVTRTVLPIAPRYVDAPPAAGDGKERGVDLFGPVFADGEWPRPRTLRDCDPVSDPEMTGRDCQRELTVARGVNRAFDPRQGTDDFAREARHNEAVRRYREAPGAAGYPGIPCQVLHRC